MLVSGYSDFSLAPSGVRTVNYHGAGLAAHFTLDNDVSPVFPYINAALPEVLYHEHPEYVQFFLDNIKCTIYAREAYAGPFANEDEARQFIDRLLAMLNDTYADRHATTPNFKKTRRVPVMDIYRLLPGTNCGECGFPTCLAFAGALSQGQVGTNHCPEMGKPIYESAVYPVLDRNGNLTATVALEIENSGPGQTQSVPAQADETLPEHQGPVEIIESDIRVILTERELEVLKLVAEGATNVEIADRLSISSHTVKSHIVNMFNKMGVNDRTQAAVIATRHNII
jgi:DNA-binding CsgD family transcriptional regulator/ArsR family metal-binding transcriptional regulator